MFNIQDIGKSFNFQVYPSALLGANFTRVKLMALLSADSVREFEPAIKHRQVFPSLPAGTPDDYRLYLYGKFTLENGEVVVLGLPWIKQETLKVNTNTTVTVVLQNVSAADIPRLSNALRSNNFNSFEVKAGE